MNRIRSIASGMLLLFLMPTMWAQKMKVGYDKSIDFSKYKTYSTQTTAKAKDRPLLYSTISNSIYQTMKSKSFEELPNGGDLLLICTGAFDINANVTAGTPILPTYSGPPLAADATMWTGAMGTMNVTSVSVPQGTLILTFADPSTHKILWSGTVTQNLDIEHKDDSLKKIDRAVAKLLSKFPPDKK